MSFVYDCAGCGEQVVRQRRHRYPRVFCSRGCYQKSSIVHADRDCPQCGRTFSPRKGSRSGPRSGRVGRRYCSVACFGASRATTTKTCPVCGEEFTVGSATAHRYNVCSLACKTATTMYVDCERCGKRFRAEKHLNRRFCSEKCRRPPSLVDCLHCGEAFRKGPGDTKRRFCSFSCYRRFTGETALESTVRCALECLAIPFEQEFQIGRWSVDFALPGHGVAIEADGEYWHSQSADRDARRDTELAGAGWRVVRLAEGAIKSAGSVTDLVLARLREATGLGLTDLAISNSAANYHAHARIRRRKGRDMGTIEGQLPLWDGGGLGA